MTEEGFVINPATGVITTTKELDKELRDHYVLTGTQPDLRFCEQQNAICFRAPILEHTVDNFVSVTPIQGNLEFSDMFMLGCFHKHRE